MLSLSTSAIITSYITLFLGYLLAIGPMGFINAWIGKVVGDTTAEDEGLLTLDPLVHIDPLGMICLLLCGIGWSKTIPIRIADITDPYRKSKIALALFGETVFGLLLVFAGICIFFMLGAGPNNGLISGPPTSLLIAIHMVLIRFIFLVQFMAIAHFLFGIVLLVILLLSKNYPSHAMYLSEMSFFITLGLIIFIAPHLAKFCTGGLVQLCTLLGQLTGFSL